MERKHGGGGWIYGGRRHFGEQRLDESLPWALERVAIDAEGLQGGKLGEPAGEGVHFIAPDADRVKLVKINEGIREGADTGRVCDEDAEVQKVGEKDREDAQGV
jgi:hypothetical protein